MYRLTARIEIRAARLWVIDHVTEVEITRSIEDLTGTCKITLPKKLKWDGAAEIPIECGNAVKVWLGYDDQLALAFAGYVREVGFKTPIVLQCEDDMFKLKQKTAAKKAYRSVTLSQLLTDQNTGYTLRVMGEQDLGQYRVKSDTVASLLGELGQQGVKAFFRYEDGKPVLYCGVIFDRSVAISQVFSNGVNIISDSSLEQQKASTMRIRLKAVSLMPNNKKKVKVEVGDADGETRTIHTYNKNEAQLKAWAEQELKRIKRDGLKGSFTTFGHKLIERLDLIGLIIDGKKQGVYQVQKNTIKYGTSGFRQEITLGQRVRE